MSRKFIYYFLLPIYFFLPPGVLCAQGDQATAAKTTVANVNNISFLNPLTECIRNKGLRMNELKSFKGEIEKYLNQRLKNREDLTVSYYFRDMNNGIWIGLNERETFIPASLMKVPTMIAVLKEVQVNAGLLDIRLRYIAAFYKDIFEEAGYKKQDSGVYTVNELLIQSIEYSDNAATLMLRSFVGDDKVSKVEDELNLHVKKPYDPEMNFVLVKNYAGVFRVLYNASYLNEEMSQKALQLLAGSKYESGIRAAVPSDIPVVHKYGKREVFVTGTTKKTTQLHHFGLVYYPGKPFLIGVMVKGGSGEEKEKIIYDLAKITYQQVDKQMR